MKSDQQPCRLVREHNTTPDQLKALVKELFLWMHEHGISSVEIHRRGTKANVIVDGRGIE